MHVFARKSENDVNICTFNINNTITQGISFAILKPWPDDGSR